MLFLISPLDCRFRRSEFNNSLLYQNEGGGNTAKLTSTSLPHSSFLPSPPLYKNDKKPVVDKKSQACETLILSEGFIYSSCRFRKQSVCCSLTLNRSEHLIWWEWFQICSGNNNTSLSFYACEVIHLINKGVTSPYVPE